MAELSDSEFLGTGTPSKSDGILSDDEFIGGSSSKTSAPLSWADVGKQAVSNIPSSAAGVASSIAQPFIHPIETATNVKNVAQGALEKTGVLSGDEHKKYADAVGQFFADRYGGMENVKHTLAHDPVGVAADLSALLTGGETALARAPGILGTVGDVAGTVGRAIDPVTNAAKIVKPVANVAGNITSHALGLTTGVGAEPIKTAARAGYEGDTAAQAFQENLRGNAPMSVPVEEAKEALSNMRQQRGLQYRQGMQGLSTNQTVYPGIWQDVANSLNDSAKVKTFKGVDLSPSTQGIRQGIFDDVSNWYRLNPADFHTLEGFDALKKMLYDKYWDVTKDNTSERKVLSTVTRSIGKAIERADPEYAKIMNGYESAQNQIGDIEKTLSLNNRASIDTSLRKLQSVLRDNVNTSFGRRAELAKYLVDAGAPNLLNRLAGQAMKPWTPRGLSGHALTVELGMQLGALALGHPHALYAAPYALASSPRLVGEAAYYAGKLSHLFPNKQALRAAYQTGRLQPAISGQNTGGAVTRESGGSVVVKARDDGGPVDSEDYDPATEAEIARTVAADRLRQANQPSGGRQEGLATDIITKAPGVMAGNAIQSFMAGPKLMADVAHGDVDPTSEEGIRRATNVALSQVGRAMPSKGVTLGAGATIPAKAVATESSSVGGLSDMIKAYHGSPHDFERFDLSKIGTGEGAQAYGHGIYVAESPAVAESYRTAGPAGNMPAPSYKAPSDVLTGDAKKFGQLAVTNPLLVEGFGGLDVKGRSDVLPVMRRLLQDDEVGKAVVRLLPVDVMHMLGGEKLTPEGLLKNPSMLVDLLPRHANDAVSGRVQAIDALAPYVARATAERPLIGPELAGQLNEALSARSASKGDLHVRSEIPYPSRPGKMYQVAIKANPEHFLDWDKPLSEQHPKVREILQQQIKAGAGSDRYKAEKFLSAPTKTGEDEYKAVGGQIYSALASDSQADLSRRLKEAGIPGIKYLDQGSRPPRAYQDTLDSVKYYGDMLKKDPGNQFAADQLKLYQGDLKKHESGTRNYVVFDDKLIDVLKKYGVAGIGALPAMNAYHFQKKDQEQRANGGKVQGLADGGTPDDDTVDLTPSTIDPMSGVMQLDPKSGKAWNYSDVDVTRPITHAIETAKSVATAPLDALTGKLQVNDPETGMPTPEAMKRASEFSQAVMTGGLPMAEEGALGITGGRLRDFPTQVYHGTKTPGFDEFAPPAQGQYMPDRALGVHVAKDPRIAETFAKDEGGIYPLNIPPDEKFLEVNQELHPYIEDRNTPKTSRNVNSDQNAIEKLIYGTVYKKNPEMLARYLEEARAVPKEDALRLATDMSKGKKVELPVDGPGWDLDRFIKDFNGKPYNQADRDAAVDIFKKEMQDQGYVGLKYINTSPMETENAKDPTSYVVFNPNQHIASRYALRGDDVFSGMPTYSAAGDAVANAKAKVMQPSQWLGYLKNQPGVKPSELEHVGLEEWLKSQTGPVTKAKVEEYIQSQQPEIQEVRKSSNSPYNYQGNEWQQAIDQAEARGDWDEAARIGRAWGGINEETGSTAGMPKYAQYQLPGAKPGSYGETLLTLPTGMQSYNKFTDALRAKYGQGGFDNLPLTQAERAHLNSLYGPAEVEPYKSSHWDEPNVLLHVRHNDREIPGVGNSLHIDELQSDWHQAGRKQGYKTPEIKQKFERANQEYENEQKNISNIMASIQKEHGVPSAAEAIEQRLPVEERAALVDKRMQLYNNDPRYIQSIENLKRLEREKYDAANSMNVPDAPFKQTWPDLGLKRMLFRAATEKNPDGSYKYQALSWTPGEAQAARYDLSKQVSKVMLTHGENDKGGFFTAYDKNGNQIIDKQIDNAEKELPDIIGKEGAKKLIDQESKKTKSGMFYEKKLEGENLRVGGEGMKSFYDKMLVDKANALSKKYGTKVQRSQLPKDIRGYEIRQSNGKYEVYDHNGNMLNSTTTRERAQQYIDGRKAGEAEQGDNYKVHALPITPELRAAASKGFPTFNTGGAVNRASGGRIKKTLEPEDLKIDRNHDVPYLSELSKDGGTFYIDRTIPRRIMLDRKPLDPVQPLLRHECAEYTEMRRVEAEFEAKHRRQPNDKERMTIYKDAHLTHGNLAERNYIESVGHRWSVWNDWAHKQINRLQKKAVTKLVPNPDVRPAPHTRGNVEEVLGRACGGRVEARNINPNPTEAQKKAGNYAKDHVCVHGLDISVENARGSKRSGVGKDGKPWSVKLPYNYGYIKGTRGADKDHVDVLLGPHIKSRKVFVVDQHDAESGKFDEHKTGIGWATIQQFRNAYINGFSDGKGKDRMRHIAEMDIDQFKDWLSNGDTTKPIKKAA